MLYQGALCEGCSLIFFCVFGPFFKIIDEKCKKSLSKL